MFSSGHVQTPRECLFSAMNAGRQPRDGGVTWDSLHPCTLSDAPGLTQAD